MLILVAVGLVYRSCIIWSVGNFIPQGSTFILGGRMEIGFRENSC
jgi:hypothetical protein